MKAVVFHGVNDVRVEEKPTPKPGPGEAVIKVKAAAVCGTDLRIIANGHKTVKTPAILGHEVVGEIHALGEGANGLKKGDTIVVVTPVGCGECRFCRSGFQNMCHLVSKETHSLGYYCDGGFAEYMRIPAEAVANGNLIPFKANGTSFEEISLVEPLSCVINGQRFLNIQPGESVAIFGCGAIACLHAILARSAGASQIIMIDVNQNRIDVVADLGIADTLILSTEQDVEKEIAKVTDEEGVDNAICACSSAEAQKLAFQVTRIRGKISLFGGVPAKDRMVTLDTNDIHYQEKSVFGAFASCHSQYQEALDLILQKKISLKGIISKVIPIEEFDEGIQEIRKGTVLKVIVKPQGENA